ncbi:MAG: glycosyltransferase [Isosphaeraceae bacterium]|nr:glycosyltransferase [Isosphaeraceae bacterium]
MATHDRKFNVVHLTYALDMGGCERLQVEFAKWADRDKFDLRFVAIDSLGRVAKIIEGLGWPVDTLSKPQGFQPHYFFKLAQLLRRWKVDVIHTHDNGPMFYGAVAARMSGVPVVVHTRHHGKLPWVSARQVKIASVVSRMVDSVCGVSKDSLREGILEGIPKSRLKTVWNGIDTTRFHFDPERLGRPGPLVSVACLRPDKNTESLIQATAKIIRQDPTFVLKLAGDGQPERVNMLKQMAVDLGVADHVIFLGNVADVPALLAESSVMVLPSTTEGISVAILEAMACGVPVIATAVGGNPEVVEHEVTGLLVPANDADAIADAMLRLHRDPELRKRFGAGARRKVVRDFEVRRMVAEYEAIYLEHLGEPDDSRLRAVIAEAEKEFSAPPPELAVSPGV